MRSAGRHAVTSALAAATLAALLAGCGADAGPLGGLPGRVDGEAGGTSTSEAPQLEAPQLEAPQLEVSPSTPPEVPPEPGPAPEPAPEPAPDPAVAADLAAGVLAGEVAATGPGTTAVVPGTTAATAVPSAPDRSVALRVEVEDGLPIDGGAFASFVMTTLQDPRGWQQEGWSFTRTDGDADVVLTLASPATSAAMCAPLQTGGTLSCRNGDDVVLTHYRWVHGAEAYGADLTAYRHYLVSHEVGHALGNGHAPCPGAGQPAPTMMQQTKGVGECTAQPWPHP